MEQTADIALIGLAVMGQNLIMNMNDHGYTVVAFNRTTSKVDEFLNDAAKGRATILGAHSIEEMVKLLKRPRKIMLMVKAGKPVDEFIETLLPFLEPGDLIIDGGNSHFPDTIRRTHYLESKGMLFIGTGVSGGEEGARFGPSMMPGGSVAAWPRLRAACYKRNWHLESPGFSLSLGWRAGTHRESSHKVIVRVSAPCRNGFGADHGTNG